MNASTEAPLFTAWLDGFFASYYRRRPVNATFIGKHEYDHRLPDFSEAGVDETLAEMEGLLRRLRALPQEPLTAIEKLDRNLAEGFLEIQIWEYQSDHFQRGNPCLYTGEAIFGVLSLFLSEFAPIHERVETAIERLRAIPGFLRQAERNLARAPIEWTERAARECSGALAFLEEGAELLIAGEGITDPAFREAAGVAAMAFRKFLAYLEGDLSASKTQNYACGEEAFDLMMRKGHFVEMSPDEIAAYAENELQMAQLSLDAYASDFGAATAEEALAKLEDIHSSLEGYLGRYAEFWEAARQASQSHALLTWPDFPIQYVPQPVWARKAAPSLYFLFYRAPAAFQRPPVHRYLVTPIEAGLAPAEQERLLRANNDSVIKLNHVVHHGGIGHHVQNWNAYHSASKIGQIAAVDCASRIALFCGGTMAEGWAVYATDLIAETGFLSPLEQYSEHQTRRRMCARAVVDARLHQGRFSLDEAARYYEEKAGMSAGAAKSEAVKNSMFPGAAVMYVTGSDRIHRLRQNLSRRLRERFDLRQFHDRFLSYGSVPVELIAREMENVNEHA